MVFSLNVLILKLVDKIINLVMNVCNLHAVWLKQDLYLNLVYNYTLLFRQEFK